MQKHLHVQTITSMQVTNLTQDLQATDFPKLKVSANPLPHIQQVCSIILRNMQKKIWKISINESKLIEYIVENIVTKVEKQLIVRNISSLCHDVFERRQLCQNTSACGKGLRTCSY